MRIYINTSHQFKMEKTRNRPLASSAPNDQYKIYGKDTLKDLMTDATINPRRRAALQVHQDYSDPIQRVLIAGCKDTYVAPHSHPDKQWELVLLISGAMDILIFAENGLVESRISLEEDSNLLCEYPANKFHTAVVNEPNTFVFEIKDGPYIPERAKIFPHWSPPEKSAGAGPFLEKLRKIQPGENIAK